MDITIRSGCIHASTPFLWEGMQVDEKQGSRRGKGNQKAR